MAYRPTVEMDVERIHMEPGMSFEVNHKGGVVIVRLKNDGTLEAFVAGKKLEVKDYQDFYLDESESAA